MSSGKWRPFCLDFNVLNDMTLIAFFISPGSWFIINLLPSDYLTHNHLIWLFFKSRYLKIFFFWRVIDSNNFLYSKGVGIILGNGLAPS